MPRRRQTTPWSKYSRPPRRRQLWPRPLRCPSCRRPLSRMQPPRRRRRPQPRFPPAACWPC
ncbi:MAG: hypothetical protein D6791_08515 [Chloroflexi bacterium]|nr:MAG: hypothetical protein D6791_08515 [Chloroflexota bacterium]